MLKFWSWTKDDWTFVIAVVALILPWATAGYKRFFKGGVVDIYETGLVQIGYSMFGATIGLFGTLRTRDRDLFIQSAHLSLVKVKDDSKRRFEWAAFRTAKTIIGQAEEVAIDIPSSFMISTVEPYRYNILFYDVALFQEVRPILENVRQSWLAYVQQQQQLNSLTDQVQALAALNQAYTEFSNRPECGKAFTDLDRLFYWEPGTYQLTLNVLTARPNRLYAKTWSFTLLENDVNNLRLNVVSTLEETCGMPLTSGQYNFIFAPYTRTDES